MEDLRSEINDHQIWLTDSRNKLSDITFNPDKYLEHKLDFEPLKYPCFMVFNSTITFAGEIWTDMIILYEFDLYGKEIVLDKQWKEG